MAPKERAMTSDEPWNKKSTNEGTRMSRKGQRQGMCLKGTLAAPWSGGVKQTTSARSKKTTAVTTANAGLQR